MRQIKKIALFFVGVIIALIILNIDKVDASSASITSSKTVNVGQSVTITGSTTAGSWNLTLSGAGQTKGLVGQTSTTANQSASTSITFTPTEAKTYTFTLKGDITDYVTDASTDISKTCTITAVNTTSNSSNSTSNSSNNTSNNSGTSTATNNKAKLSNITVSPVDFSGFRRDNPGPYRVTVENNVTSVKVSASGLNGSRGVVNGGSNLQEGTNKITVTAYSGNTAGMVYTIYVTRKAGNGEEIVPNEVDEEKTEEKTEEKKELRLNNIVLDDSLNVVLDPVFDSEIFEYKVVLGNEYLDLDELLINAIANVEGATITIDGNKDLIDGENIVTITVEAEGYDTVWYRIKVIKGPIEEPEEIIVDAEPQIEYNAAKILREKIIISGGTLIIALFGIFFIAKECYETSNKNIEEEDEDNNLEDDDFDRYIEKDEDEDLDENTTNNYGFSSNNILEDIYNNNNPYNSFKDESEGQNKEDSKNNILEEIDKKPVERLEYTEEKPKRSRRKGKGKHA